jgi:hypothetical protein
LKKVDIRTSDIASEPDPSGSLFARTTRRQHSRERFFEPMDLLQHGMELPRPCPGGSFNSRPFGE